jgi:DNA polymerase
MPDAPWYGALLACRACNCRREAKQVVPGVGPSDAEIAFVGLNPGYEEDRDGRPFVGRSGDELDVWLRTLMLDRSKVFVTNTCKCHTEKDRKPLTSEIGICSDLWLRRELQFLSGLKVVVALGAVAREALLGRTRESFGLLDGWQQEATFEGRTLRVFPVPHPAYFLRMPHLRTQFLTVTLPSIAEAIRREVPDVYGRAASRSTRFASVG